MTALSSYVVFALGIILFAQSPSLLRGRSYQVEKARGLSQQCALPALSPGDSIWSFSYPDDQGLGGVEFDGSRFLVTGDNYGGDYNMVYVFDKWGKYIRDFAQNPENSWPDWSGWLDLAYRADHDYFFGSDDSMITAFDELGNILYEVRGPYNRNWGLAWDGQYLWASNGESSIVKLDTSGVITASYSNPYWVWGLAWDDASEGGPWLWVSASEGPWSNRIYQFDPSEGQYTGFYFEGAYKTAAGGLAFSCDWDTTRAILFELCQKMPDYVVAYDLGPIERSPTATIDLKPEVLNLKSRGRWLTCYIELSTPYDAEQIDRSSVKIEEIDDKALDPPIRAEGPSDIGDYDDDSIPDLMVKFSRRELISHFQDTYGAVTILVAGELCGGKEFEGSDSLRVIEPPESNRGAMVDWSRSALAFDLRQTVPSPFSSSTRISYQIPDELEVTLSVFDLRGRLVRTLVSETRGAGTHSVEWFGDDDQGRPLPAGVYLYRLDAGQWSATRKTVVVR